MDPICNAFPATGLGSAAFWLLLHVIEGGGAPVELPVRRLAHDLGVDRSNLSRSIKMMLRRGILVRSEGGYTVNRESWKWSPVGGARTITQPAPPPDAETYRAAELARIGRDEGADLGLCERQSGEPLPLDSGAVNDPVELERLRRDVDERYYPDTGWGRYVRMYEARFPVEIMRAAFERTSAWGRPPASFRPIYNEMQRLSVHGIPEPEKPTPAGPAGPPDLQTAYERNRRVLKERYNIDPSSPRESNDHDESVPPVVP